MLKIYLCGPVDNCSTSEQTVWRHIVKQIHPEYKYLDPMSYEVDYFRGKINMDQVINFEKKDIEDCDVLLAYPWKSSSGTAMEIMYAYMINMIRDDLFDMNPKRIKIIVVIEKDKYLSPWISHHSDVVVDDFHSAFDWIEKNVSA